MARASGFRSDAATCDPSSILGASIIETRDVYQIAHDRALELARIKVEQRIAREDGAIAPRATLVLCPGCGYSYWCPRGGVLPAGEYHCNKGPWIFDRDALDWIAWRPGVEGWGEPEEVGFALTNEHRPSYPHPLMILVLLAVPALLGIGGLALWELVHPLVAIAAGIVGAIALGMIGTYPDDDGWNTE